MPNASEVLVYISDDGSARELTEADKKYIDTEFSPLDGARPYIKSHYSQRTASGEIRGYLPRTEVPDGMPIGPAPPEMATQQQTPPSGRRFDFRIDPKTDPKLIAWSSLVRKWATWVFGAFQLSATRDDVSDGSKNRPTVDIGFW
jgi:hypothetical protein